jgi:hypothetical protein
MKLFKVLALGAISAFVAACGGGGDAEDRLDLRDPVVRFIHAVPGGPAVTLYRGDSAQGDAANAAYKFVSEYYDVSNAGATWTVRTAATTPVVTLASANLNPSQGDRYTFVAMPNTGGAVSLKVIEDPYNKGLLTDRARVRVLHAAPVATAVDVYLLQGNQSLATATATVSALSYGNTSPASGQDSLELNGGTYRLVLTAAGTKNVVFNANSVSIGNNADWLMLAIPGPTGLAGDVRVLVAQGNDDVDGETIELVSQP